MKLFSSLPAEFLLGMRTYSFLQPSFSTSVWFYTTPAMSIGDAQDAKTKTPSILQMGEMGARRARLHRHILTPACHREGLAGVGRGGDALRDAGSDTPGRTKKKPRK